MSVTQVTTQPVAQSTAQLAKRVLRVAVGSVFHETSHFLTTQTDLAVWRNSYIHHGAELYALRHTPCEIGGILATCETEGIEVVPLLAARCVSGGPNTAQCYSYLREALLAPLRQQMPVDGVILALHGAMTAVDEDDPEGDLLQAVRENIGPDVPMVATLDLHAHVTQRMVEKADALVAFAHYPHDDAFETGERGTRLLLATMRGQIKPTMALAKVPILCSGVNGQTSGDGPMAHLTRAARTLEQATDVLSVSIFHVQHSNDLPDMGCGAVVITNDKLDLAAAKAAELAQDFWQRRHALEATTIPVTEAVAQGREVVGGPILLVDTSDCVGGGAAGDSVALLAELQTLGVDEPTLLMVVDPEAVQQCAYAGIGQSVTLWLGYKIDPIWGKPLCVTGRVRHLLDGEFQYTGGLFGGTHGAMGLSAVLQVGAIAILIMSRPTYDWADEQYRAAGLFPEQAKFIGVKNPINYRMGYSNVAKAAWIVDTPGPTPATVRQLPYRRMQRPFFPLDVDIPGLQPTVYTHPFTAATLSAVATPPPTSLWTRLEANE